MNRFWLAIMMATLFVSAAPSNAQQSNGPSVHMVVTAEGRHGQAPPVVDRDNVLVYQNKVRDRVTSWVPATGDHAQLELFVLLDDSSSTSLGSQLGDIQAFINAQPATTKVGVAYMQNGTAQIVQNLTTDHAQAGKSLRLPLGVFGVNASPYFSLSDLIKKWPSSAARREIVMVTDGIDPYYGMPDLADPYLNQAIADAQHAGIVVYGIYNPGAGHFGHSYWQSYWGQLYLSRLTDETGGESYYIGFSGPAVAFKPFLDSVEKHLKNQYLLEFNAQPVKKSGLQRVRIMSERTDYDLVAADHVYVPAGK